MKFSRLPKPKRLPSWAVVVRAGTQTPSPNYRDEVRYYEVAYTIAQRISARWHQVSRLSGEATRTWVEDRDGKVVAEFIEGQPVAAALRGRS